MNIVRSNPFIRNSAITNYISVVYKENKKYLVNNSEEKMQKKCARACVYEKYFVSLQPLMIVDS